jgi:transcriptional regulator of acetoin/glycerol metabolism
MNYDWPRNVRELQQTVEGSITRCEKNTILLEHLPEDVAKETNTEDQSHPIPDELQKILRFLGKHLLEDTRLRQNNTSNPLANKDDKLKDFISFVISRDDPRIHRRDYESVKGISKASANRLFKEMVESGVLSKRGRGRGTYYTISPRRLIELSNRYKLTF